MYKDSDNAKQKDQLVKEDINSKINTNIKELIKYNKKKKYSLIIGILFLIAICILIYFNSKNSNNFSFRNFWVQVLIIFSSIFASARIILFFNSTKIIAYQQEFLDLQGNIELLDMKNLNTEEKAHKQFMLNQRELKRYYDLNLSQTRFLYRFGVFLMIIGIVIIMTTISIYTYVQNTSDTLLLIGSISGILVDFIGAIFISTYAKTVETAIQFHSKLTNSNNLLLANLLASKINNSELKDATLSDIAKNISTLNNL